MWLLYFVARARVDIISAQNALSLRESIVHKEREQ